MSLEPASVIMTGPGMDEPERTPLKQFLYNHVKTIVTVFMIFGTIAVIVLIVMGKIAIVKFDKLLLKSLLVICLVSITGLDTGKEYAFSLLLFASY